MVIRKRSASIYSEKRINWDLRIVTSTEIAVGDDICLAYRDMQWEDFFWTLGCLCEWVRILQTVGVDTGLLRSSDKCLLQ